MQSVSSKIWTRVAVSISYDDNHYTTGTMIAQLEFELTYYNSTVQCFNHYTMRTPLSVPGSNHTQEVLQAPVIITEQINYNMNDLCNQIANHWATARYPIY